jgi:kynurenine formamidase
MWPGQLAASVGRCPPGAPSASIPYSLAVPTSPGGGDLPRIIDLSVPISPGGGEPLPPKIKYYNHSRGGSLLALAPAQDPRSRGRSVLRILRGLVTGKRVRKRDFPGGVGMAWESMRTESHHGTHVDAPWHYGPTTAGRPARTIDQLPLEWFLGPGVRLDFRAKAPGTTITVADVEQALTAAGHTLRPNDIVLIWTGADELWGRPEYLERYCGLGAESTRWLLDHGVIVIGTDAWSLDRPPMFMGSDFLRDGDSSHLWPAHFVGREREYCQIEKLAHLGDLPAASGFTVACFPVLIERASAGWTRAVAIVPDEIA